MYDYTKQLSGKYDVTTVRVMFELLRAAICSEIPQIEDDINIDWDQLRRISAEQGLLSWVWDGICLLPQERQPPRFQKISWSLSAQEVYERYKRQQNVLKELVEVCRLNNMRLMLLKGIGLSKLYPKPESRPSGDIDIYLFDDFEKGNKIFSSNKDTDLHTDFFYKGVHVENHMMLVYPNTSTKKLVSRYLSERVNHAVKTSDGYWFLEPQDNLVYLMMHALNHVNFGYGTSFLNIRNLTDITMVIAHYRTRWNSDEIFLLMRRLHLEKSFELMVYFSEWLHGIELPEFHKGLIKEDDVSIIKDLFMKRCLYVPIPTESSFLKRIRLSVTRYCLLRRLYQYIPQHKKSFLLTSIRQSVSNYQNMFE